MNLRRPFLRGGAFLLSDWHGMALKCIGYQEGNQKERHEEEPSNSHLFAYLSGPCLTVTLFRGRVTPQYRRQSLLVPWTHTSAGEHVPQLARHRGDLVSAIALLTSVAHY